MTDGFPVAVQCAWCGHDLPVKDTAREPGLISHGMCAKCWIEAYSEQKNAADDYDASQPEGIK
jgi:hypothetical protein